MENTNIIQSTVQRKNSPEFGEPGYGAYLAEETRQDYEQRRAARKAYYRKIISLSDEMRTRFKTRLLSLTRSQVMQAAEKYFDKNGARRAVAVISGEDKLKAANAKLSGKPLELHRI